MAENLIPQTRMRLKPYITIYAVKGGAFFENPADFAAKAAAGQVGGFVLIGAVEKLKESQTRETNGSYNELNADESMGTFGKPVETFPGLIKYHLELTKVVLHDANMLEAFGYDGGDLVKQKTPLIVQLSKPVPLQADGRTPLVVGGKPLQTEVKTYYGCWFDKNEQEFDSTSGDLKLIQSATMIATGCSVARV